MNYFADYPMLYLLLLLPILAVAPAILSRLLRKRWTAFVAPRLRQRLLEHDNPIFTWITFACTLVALGLLIATLARPQGLENTRTEMIEGRNILIALDLSRSMKVADIQPDRLTQAKATCHELLDALPNDRIGLIGFAGSAYLFAPLTVDHAAVRETISQIDIDWIPTGGSNLAGGLELGIDTLRQTGASKNALILMSDGEEHSGSIAELAAEAKAAGVRVISIGFGTTTGGKVPDPRARDGLYRDRSGKTVTSRMETQALEDIARNTGGKLALASSGADIPQLVAAAVADLEQSEQGSREISVAEERYPWFLLPAILFLMAATLAGSRWRGTAAAAVIGLSAILCPTPAAAISVADAKRAMKNEDFKQAMEAYSSLAEKDLQTSRALRFRLAEGTAAYRAGDFSSARRAFSQALQSPNHKVQEAAHQGLGNTLFQQGWERLSNGLSYPKIPSFEQSADRNTPPNAFDRLSDALIEPPEKNATGDMADFERLAKQQLQNWLKEPGEIGVQSEGSKRFEQLVTDWMDAAKHYGSGTSQDHQHNRTLVLTYLAKLEKILSQIKEHADQLQQLSDPGQGQEQQDDSQNRDDQNSGNQGESDDDKHQSERSDSDREDQQDADQGRQDESKSGDQDDEQQPQQAEEQQASQEPKPGESPEETARRVLEENSDLQKGALNPGRRTFRRPEKDW